MYSASDVVKRRKELWNENKDILLDTDFRNSVAEFMVSSQGENLRNEFVGKPDMFIEGFFCIVDKEQNTVPFFINDVQRKFLDILFADMKLYDEGKINHLKYIILKGRQQGFTSIVNALQVAIAVTTQNFSGYTLADNADNAEDIFSDKGKYYFDCLPDLIKPTERYNSRRELDLRTNDGSGMNSKWRVSTAGNKDAGRSKTLSFFHGSECAFWSNCKEVLVGLSEAFTKNCIVVLESTANGYNQFKELWDEENNYKCLFFEWWLTPEYSLNFESDDIKADFLKKIENADKNECDDANSTKWVYSRLKWLRNKGLTDNQLYWYFNKWRDKKETIKQEYPCSAEESFLASGRTYFPITALMDRLDKIEDIDYIKGFFTCDYTNSDVTGEKLIIDSTINFIEDTNGYIKIFKKPDVRGTYVVSADTAGEGSDYNAGHVLDEDGFQCAVIRLIEDEDLYADQLYCLGYMYNMALISVEINFSTYVNNTLKNREYPNLYIRETSPDNIAVRTVPKYGFNTNRSTRPQMLGMLKEFVRDYTDRINDIDTLQEMVTFIVDDKGKPIAMEGHHDDLVMSYAIGLYSLSQVYEDYEETKPIPDGFYFRSELEDMGYSKFEIDNYFREKR